MTAPMPIVAARMRYKKCQDISTCARFIGLDATPEKVNRKYDIWVRWYEGRLATGYLMRLTGVKRIKRPQRKVTNDPITRV